LCVLLFSQLSCQNVPPAAPAPVPVAVESAAPTPLKPVTELPRSATAMAILVSDDTPAFTQVADAIKARAGGAPFVYQLHGDPVRAARAVRSLQASDRKVIVAIGWVATQAASKIKGKRVIFCQVFNYEVHGLTTPGMQGVSATPPVAQTFGAWKSLDPKLKRVGVITGGGLKDLMGEARAAARAHGLQLQVATVRSDKEMLYAFKHMSTAIDGFWLLPDNRVLSGEVIRELMAYGVKAGKQLLVFTPDLLPHGGVISATSDNVDIADQVLARVQEPRRKTNATVSTVARLTVVRIQVNTTVAKQLGLAIPPSLAVVPEPPRTATDTE
jgi:ABC-type uncharacterized transport system substrate-binding protein